MNMNINDLLRGVDCECGRRHECAIRYVYVEENATRHLGNILADYTSVLMVADENTYRAAAEGAERELCEKKITRVIFPGEHILVPNEDAIERVTAALGDADIILGIGSGVIQDLCKYVSSTSKIPYAVVATAPSMDGYASSGAAMITGGMKVTYPAGVPFAIIADTSVIANAPIEMIKAGYGDIIGKYSALNDWRLGALVNGEYLCEYIYGLTYDTVLQVLPLAKKLLMRDKDAMKKLMEALILVGVAMSFATNSRPASGSEHHLSHFCEITGIVNGTEYLPHGIDVLFSTAITAKIREKLLLEPQFSAPTSITSEGERNAEIKRVYGPVADGCIELQKKLGTYGQSRIQVYTEKEELIKKILSSAPSYDEIIDIISEIELNIKDFFDLYTVPHINDAIRYAKDLKDRYTVLWMYFDLFGTDEIL